MTTSELRDTHQSDTTPHGEPPQPEMALGLKYLKAVERAGGIPVVIPPLKTAALEPLLDQVTGVCLSGGPDLDPVAYGARRHARTGPTWSELDEFELALAREADARGLPILAVCRGLQVLNVARSGTLVQHLPDVVAAGVEHRQSLPGRQATHWVSIVPSSRLHAILGCRRTKVNSFHHQAVDSLGEGLVVSARAGDGTVEGIEAMDRDFVVGVQWHAECLSDRPSQIALFRALVVAALQPKQLASGGAQLARAA